MRLRLLALVLGPLLLLPTAAADAAPRDKHRRSRGVIICDDGRHDRPVARRGRGHRHAPRLACGCHQVWVPGHYDRVPRKVRSRGHYETVWVRGDCSEVNLRFGRRFAVNLGGGGYYKKVWREGRTRTVYDRVWVPGHYEVREKCRRHRGGGRHQLARYRDR